MTRVLPRAALVAAAVGFAVCGSNTALAVGVESASAGLPQGAPNPMESLRSSQAPFRVLSVEPDPALTQMLAPRESGWIGSDAVHSIPLPNGSSVWLFGDTFIGTVAAGARQSGAAFINNTIGIQDRRIPPPGGMEFFWGPNTTSFFPHQPNTPGSYYWPTMGVCLRGELFIFCYTVSPVMRLHSATLIRVPNPEDSPEWWIKKVYDFRVGGRGFHIHSALHVAEPYVYFLGTQSRGFNSWAVLARARIDDLVAGELGECLEYWVQTPKGPAWGANPDNLVPLFSPGVTETNIQHEPLWDMYFVTTYNARKSVISLTAARELTGPWSTPVPIYEAPEPRSVSFPIISYAARPHPELSTAPGELVITYATNASFGIASLYTPEGLQIYAPRVIRVRVEPVPDTSSDERWMLHDSRQGPDWAAVPRYSTEGETHTDAAK